MKTQTLGGEWASGAVIMFSKNGRDPFTGLYGVTQRHIHICIFRLLGLLLPFRCVPWSEIRCIDMFGHRLMETTI